MARRLARPEAAASSPSAGGPPADGDASAGLDRLIDARLPGLRRRLLAAGAPFTPSQVVLGSLAAFGLLLVALYLAAVPALVAIALAVWGGLAGPVLVLSILAARRQQRFLQQMPQAVDLMARSLQAGHPVTTAMTVAARQMPDPIGPELSVVIAEMSLGLERDAALRNLLRRFPLPELRMFAACLEVTRETGGNVAETLLNLGETMRAKGQLRKKVAAISAEGRMSFWVVSILPVAVVGMLLLLAPAYFLEVAPDPLFWPLMSAPPILWGIGALMIWRMINFKI
jgi:tight adherence protein B